jgi:translocation and assembly module TamA
MRHRGRSAGRPSPAADGLYAGRVLRRTISILVGGSKPGIDRWSRAFVSTVVLFRHRGTTVHIRACRHRTIGGNADARSLRNRRNTARSDDISDPRSAFAGAMRHPLALTDGQTITARHEDEKLDVIVIAPGPELRFGNAVTGNDAVRPIVLAIVGLPTEHLTRRSCARRGAAPYRCVPSAASRAHGYRQHLPMTIAVVEQTPRRIARRIFDRFRLTSGYWLPQPNRLAAREVPCWRRYRGCQRHRWDRLQPCATLYAPCNVSPRHRFYGQCQISPAR